MIDPMARYDRLCIEETVVLQMTLDDIRFALNNSPDNTKEAGRLLSEVRRLLLRGSARVEAIKAERDSLFVVAQ